MLYQSQHQRAGNGNVVQALTMAFCRAAQFPQQVLMNTITTKYFMSRNLEKPSVVQFADELASFAWALCKSLRHHPNRRFAQKLISPASLPFCLCELTGYASPEVVLKYILQLYCDDFDSEYLRLEDCGVLFEDMHNIPTLDIDARGIATAMVTEIADYAAA